MNIQKIPELDIKNLVFKTTSELLPPIAFDPIAKLVLGHGRMFMERYQFGLSHMSLAYAPHLTPEDFDGPYDEECQRIVNAKARDSAEIAEVLVGYERRGSRFVGLVRLEDFKGIGLADQALRVGSAADRTEDDPGYRFWPVDEPGRDRAIAIYFLKRLAVALVLKEMSGRDSRYPPGSVTHCAICIDKPLLDFVGHDAFPQRDQLDAIYTVVCSQEVWHAK